MGANADVSFILLRLVFSHELVALVYFQEGRGMSEDQTKTLSHSLISLSIGCLVGGTLP